MSSKYSYIPKDLDLSGKTVIITGATNGLGYATALRMLSYKPKLLIMAVRNTESGERVRTEFLNHNTVKTNHPTAAIKVLRLDLDKYAGVDSFIEELSATTSDLHVALLNAGLAETKFVALPDGHEKTMQVNTFSNALLALKLIPLLEATTARDGVPTKLTWVGSRNQGMNSLDKRPILPSETVMGHFDSKSNYSAIYTYGDSKLLVSMFIRQLAARVSSSKVIVNQVCPGLTRTNGDANAPLYLRLIMGGIRRAVARTSEDASNTFVYAAAIAGPESHGLFIKESKSDPLEKDGQVAPIMATDEGKRIEGMLWEELSKELITRDPSVAKLLP
jgi:NAD(P)-dependent dehydrogenase (short-subunit alcohol dehydrogenase family)